ncbi:glycosyltransferase family 4 protein [Patescibacteria group bacterium]|nr:glycosyltransferase family 4 protein [Patescibacteria group bacterium]MBU1889962.1 glycosyltransferase family 4 protein [Patescibacteria group bacterium]
MLNYEFPPLGGGAGNATYYLLKEFSNHRDLKIDLITSSVDTYKHHVFAPNINIHFLDIGKKGNLHYQSEANLIKYSWGAYRFAKKLKQKNDYGLIHAFFGIPCGYVAKLLKLPYLVSLRGSDVPYYNPRFKFLDKVIFQRLSRSIWEKAAQVTTNSEGLKKLALQTYPEKNIQVIYNGVDVKEFQSNSATKSFNIISTSRFIRRKGIEYLIKGFADFYKKYQTGILILVGSGNLEQELKDLVKKFDLDTVVDFRGTASHEQISHIYREADIYVLPSLNEGMSNSVLEAMASSQPIIATDTGGTKELIDSTNGFIIQKQNSHDIFQALEKLYLDKNLRTQMGQASRKKAEQLSWNKMADQYLSLYTKHAKLA